MNSQLTCAYPDPTFLIFSENVPSLIYYSHLPIIIISLLLAFFVIFKSKDSLPSKILFWTILIFVLWVFLDSVFWASNRGDVIMFIWSLQILFEPLVYIGMLYLTYAFVDKKDMPFRQKLIAFVLFLPLIFLTPTKYILSGFDIDSCLSQETFFSYYTYLIEFIFITWIVFLAGNRYKNEKEKSQKIFVFLLGLGTVLFLAAFSSGNIIGSLTEDWNTAQIGLFGMPIFIGTLTYLIVRFKVLNIKLISAQVLVASVWISIFSILFVRSIDSARVVIIATLVLITVLGVILIHGVKRERVQFEKIEKLASNLEQANLRLKTLDKQKTEFVSLASHQLRAPMTAIKGYTAMVLDGDYGDVPEEMKMPLRHVFTSTQSLIQIVSDFLDVTRIELGTMKFTFTDFDLKALVNDVVGEMAPTIDASKLEFKVDIPNEAMIIHGDNAKIKQVLNNLIDNSLKYTKVGYIHILLEKVNTTCRFTVSDSGVGISHDALPKLFDKFIRADNANQANVIGTGLGLYVARQMIQKHKGRIWAESEGVGKGSKFIFEIDGVK